MLRIPLFLQNECYNYFSNSGIIKLLHFVEIKENKKDFEESYLEKVVFFIFNKKKIQSSPDVQF